MLYDSGLLQELERYAFSPAGHPMCVYGHPAEPLPIHLQAPFRNAISTPQIFNFSKSICTVRISVEWLFGDILNYFKFAISKRIWRFTCKVPGKSTLSPPYSGMLKRVCTGMTPQSFSSLTTHFTGLLCINTRPHCKALIFEFKKIRAC